MSSNVDNRPAKQLYFKPFAAAVDAGVGSAMVSPPHYILRAVVLLIAAADSISSLYVSSMPPPFLPASPCSLFLPRRPLLLLLLPCRAQCSYNRVNNTWACEEANALNEIKAVQGFEGFMMSDWGATHSTLPAALNGLDQQMPDASFFGAPLAAAVADGSLPMSRLDDMVMRMLTPMMALNLFADPPNPAERNTSSPARTPAHDALARKLAQASITLLKNTGILPVSPEQLTGGSVVIFGDTDTVSGGGSGSVVRPYVITPAVGVSTFLNGAPPPPQPGTCTQEADTDYYQTDSPSTPATDATGCCNACANSAGCRSWTFQASTGTCFIKPNADGRRTSAGLISGNCTSPPAPLPSGPVNVTYSATQDAPTAAGRAAGADLVIMVVATDSSEGSDRSGLGLPAWQDAMVAALAAANPNLVVVARCPGACTMPWAATVPAILFELLPGQESGNSIANTIFGASNPSGRLPLTFPNPAPAGQQYPTDTWLSPVGGGPVIPTSYPGTDRGKGWPEADYSEGLFMGYRWYDQQKTSPQWPFGHGLSYSTFTYSGLAVAGTVSPTAAASVYATVCNTAGPAGAEVAQMYVGYPATGLGADEPPKQLKGFQKVGVAANDCEGVGFPIEAKDLWLWDVVAQQWTLVAGTYQIYVGSSSRDIRLTGTLTVTAN